jgi:hypothetical protein
VVCTGQLALLEQGQLSQYNDYATDWTTGVQLLAGADQIRSGTHPAFYLMGTGGLSLGIKWLEHEADHSPLSSAEVKNVWIWPYDVVFS